MKIGLKWFRTDKPVTAMTVRNWQIEKFGILIREVVLICLRSIF